MSLPSKLRQKLQKEIQKHDAFESNGRLSVLFTDPRLRLWRSLLEEEANLKWRVSKTINLLTERRNQQGQNGLVLLLTVLQEDIEEEDNQRAIFQQLIDEVKANLTPPELPQPEPPDDQTEPSAGTKFMPKPQMPDMVMIPAGPFWMGSENTDPSAYDNEKPRHEVNLGTYWIGRYPVTNGEYAIFLRQTGYEHGELTEAALLAQPDHPVTNVSQADAEAYCQWLSRVWERPFRLPTEQEWEKAARGGLPETRIYVWKDNLWQENRANTKEAGNATTTSVKQYQAINISPCQVVDLLGNVWEWTVSPYAPYRHSPHDSIDFGKTRAVIRGGSWINDWRKARISTRGRYAVETCRPYLGFRLAADATPVDRTILQKQMVGSFSQNELKDLCLALDLPQEEFSPPLTNMVRELILYCERNNRLNSLADACQQKRPQATWFISYTAT
jgi:formylglycine-generating enzyme required for sulfatase activity